MTSSARRVSRRTAAVFTVFVLIVSMLAVALPAVAIPGLELNPSSGPPGTSFDVKGTGFTQNNPVEVRWGAISGPIIGTGVSNSSGDFLVTAQVPADAQPIQYRVFACRAETGPNKCAEFAAEIFTVTTTTTTTTPPTTVTTRPPTTVTTDGPDTTTTTEGAQVVTTLPGHGAGSDDYSWWSSTSSSMPSYPYAGPTTVPMPNEGAPPVDYPDIRATNIEVTQGVQNLENDMPLVKGRRTYVRVYVDIFDEDPNITYVGELTQWPDVSGALGVWAGGQFLGTRWPENGFITAHNDGGNRTNLDDSLYFRIPPSWTEHPQLRFTTLVFATHPNTVETEERPDNNTKTVFVDFNNILDVTVHPVPLHLHRSYNATDEIRTYQGLFGGPGTYAVNSGGSLGAVDVVEGIYRYHPISSVAIEPWNSVLYPLDHASGEEWNLGPCQTTLTDIIQPGNSGYRNFLWVADADIFFDEGEEPDIADFTKPTRLTPDRTEVKVMDKVFEIDDISWDPERQAYELRGDMPFADAHPIVGAPVFATGCKKADYGQTSNYGAPLTVLGINRVWYDWDSTSEFFIGMVDPSLPSYFGGLANAGKESTWVKFKTNFSDASPWFHDGASIAGHEVGHLTYRKHVACNDSDGDGVPNELKGGAIDLTHPMTDWFPDCRLAEVDPEGWYGFDVYYGMWGLSDPTVISNDPTVAQPNLAYPVMSYLSPAWTDPYHWCRMLSYYGVDCEPNLVGIDWNPPPPEPTDGAFGTATGPVPFESDPQFQYTAKLVTGTIDTSEDPDADGSFPTEIISLDLSGSLDEYNFEFADVAGADDPFIGLDTPVIQVFDADDALVYRAPMETDNTEDRDNLVQVSATIPMAEGHYFTIELRDVRVVHTASSNAPTGEWVVQQAETDLVFLQWRAEDVDGDDLLAMVQYSNNGEQWMTLAQGKNLTEYRSEDIVSGLPGGAGQFRVLINDGWHTTTLDGPRLEVANKPPAGAILLPIPGFTFATNEEIEFEASVFDVEDRGIDPDNLVWSSSVDGEFGRGPSFDYAGLTPGEHQITLEATDSAGVVSVMVIPLIVDPDVVQPLPSDEVVELATAMLLAVDDTEASTTTASLNIAVSEEPSSSPSNLWLWILGAAVAAGGAIVIGSMWNGRDKPPE